MKAITFIQLWALLIALKVKKFETRSWQTIYRGPIAIHASKRLITMHVVILKFKRSYLSMAFIQHH
ncbi:hypothetical protein [Lysinibacillus sphaericus]|uniref:hypothetical protein n=1 Tax=Lysinibacillus sphaericus TaxID=1421 RepID=UPI0018CCC38C|nr:hypothetical protein [Lysinibacillus sphaericus]